eukprot:TRINITY_DN53966_c0_g1_i1.p1 TRINITY_DN53966_c0_g1~~TRINITY_DN53966_c0_g1_i1.p1  ORF type:complete len:727 (-),score=122.36 TRINITY_DN53966_c0_g1_i1:176-2266(-)
MAGDCSPSSAVSSSSPAREGSASEAKIRSQPSSKLRQGLKPSRLGASQGERDANSITDSGVKDEESWLDDKAQRVVAASAFLAAATTVVEQGTNEEARATGAVEIRAVQGEGLGAFATRDVAPGEQLLRVPFSFCITEATPTSDEEFAGCLRHGLDAIRRKRREGVIGFHACCWKSLPSRVQLWLYLIRSRWLEGCRHHLYLQACPQHIDLPVAWSDEDLSGLRATNILAIVQRERRLLDRLFQTYVQPLVLAAPESFPGEVFNEKAVVWAHSLLTSRGFPELFAGGSVPVDGAGSHRLALVPIVDFFNHRPGIATQWRVDQCGGVVELRVPANATTGIKRGDALWLNYGDKSADEWFMHYGFVRGVSSVQLDVSLVCDVALGALVSKVHRLRLLGVGVSANCYDDELAVMRVGPFPLKWGKKKPAHAASRVEASSPAVDGLATLVVAVEVLLSTEANPKAHSNSRAAAFLASLLDERLAQLPQREKSVLDDGIGDTPERSRVGGGRVAQGSTVASPSDGARRRSRSRRLRHRREQQACAYVRGIRKLLRMVIHVLREGLGFKQGTADPEVADDGGDSGFSGSLHVLLRDEEDARDRHRDPDGSDAEDSDDGDDMLSDEDDILCPSDSGDSESGLSNDDAVDALLARGLSAVEGARESDARPAASGVESRKATAASEQEFTLPGDGCPVHVVVASA